MPCDGLQPQHWCYHAQQGIKTTPDTRGNMQHGSVWGRPWRGPEVGVHDELPVLGRARAAVRVAPDKQERVVQVLEAGAPRAASQRRAHGEPVAHRRQLGRQHHGVWGALLVQDGRLERHHVAQELRGRPHGRRVRQQPLCVLCMPA